MFRVAAATSVLAVFAAFAPVAAYEQPQRLASLTLDIPGLTYPRAAPPDLVAAAVPTDIDMPDAVTAGATAAAAALPATLTPDVGPAEQHAAIAVWLTPQWASRTWLAFDPDLAPAPLVVFSNASGEPAVGQTP